VEIDISDRILIRLYKGDNQAFGMVYDAYAGQLLAYGESLGFDKETVKDALQDIFCNIYTHRERFREIKNLQAYLFRSLKNTLLNMAQQKGNHSVDISLYEGVFHTNVTVLDELIDAEERLRVEQKLNRYLDCLTGRQREAIYLRYIQELDYENIAEIMNLTPHATRKLVSRAIIRMRNECTGNC
jgi:RNA polymerase sigma factor (sigma-70 family)